MSEVAALVLAAGRATRFGAGPQTSKVLALLEGKPLVAWVVDAALASRARAVLVVTGQAEAGVRAALGARTAACVHNAAFATGMASSLQAGLAALPSEASGVVVLLADMPRITPAIIDTLIARFEADGARADAVVPVREGRQGNPVLLGRRLFPAIAALKGDEGARRLIRASGHGVLSCPIDDAGIETDVDTVDALDRLRSQANNGQK